MQHLDHVLVSPSAHIATLRTVRSRSLPPKAAMRVANIFVGALLRSPLHGVMSKQILLLGYTGHRSGKRYHLPIVYRRDGDSITLIAGNHWWVNVRDGAPVTLRLAGTEVHGIATPVRDRDQAERALMALLEEMPHLAKMYNAALTPEGRPDPASVKAAINTQVVVLVALEGAAPAD